MRRELHVQSHLSPLERWRHGVEIVALVVAAIWAFYTFIYQERIKPESEELRLQPTVALRHELLASGHEYVEVRFTVKNISGRDATLDGMIVNVYGRRFTNESGDRIQSVLSGITELNRTLLVSNPQLLYSFYDTWAPFGAPAMKRNVIRPGEEFHEIIAFGIKPRTFDVAKATWMYCVSNSGSGWRISRKQRPDGSFVFGNLPQNATEPYCFAQRRGESFSL